MDKIEKPEPKKPMSDEHLDALAQKVASNEQTFADARQVLAELQQVRMQLQALIEVSGVPRRDPKNAQISAELDNVESRIAGMTKDFEKAQAEHSNETDDLESEIKRRLH